MRHQNQILLAACGLAIASCGQHTEQADQAAAESNVPGPSQASTRTPTAPARPNEPRLVLEGEALVLEAADGTRLRIAFGSPAAAAVEAASAVYGPPLKVETLEECGAGPLQASRFSGLTIAAQDGKLVGWSIDGRDGQPRPTTAAGIGVGSTRRALDQAYSVESLDSSIGHEFTAKGLSGLLSGKDQSAKVTHLWAGATCIMR